MIILDTHIWLWWVNQDAQFLKSSWLKIIEQADEVGVSAISLFEVAWLQQHHRIELPCEQHEWFEKALSGSDISLIPLTPHIATLACDGKIISADKKFPLYVELANRLICA